MHLNDQNDTAAVYSDVRHENSIFLVLLQGWFWVVQGFFSAILSRFNKILEFRKISESF
jgi:hypothetical protein